MDPRRAGNYSIFKRKLKNPFIQSGLYSLDIYDFMVLVFIFGFGYTSLNVSRHSEAHVVLDDSKLKKIGSTKVFLKVSNVKQSEVSDFRRSHVFFGHFTCGFGTLYIYFRQMFHISFLSDVVHTVFQTFHV